MSFWKEKSMFLEKEIGQVADYLPDRVTNIWIAWWYNGLEGLMILKWLEMSSNWARPHADPTLGGERKCCGDLIFIRLKNLYLQAYVRYQCSVWITKWSRPNPDIWPAPVWRHLLQCIAREFQFIWNIPTFVPIGVNQIVY